MKLYWLKNKLAKNRCSSIKLYSLEKILLRKEKKKMAKYSYHKDLWSQEGCPGTYNDPGWYKDDVFVVTERINPETDLPYTPKELDEIVCPECLVPPYIPKPPAIAINSIWIWVAIGVAIALAVIFGIK
jgi:hypothetical protein